METVLRRELITNKRICRVLGVASFILLTSLGAFVRIPLPFTPVPITLQTFFVLLCGAMLGSRLGTTAQISYLIIGALGLPVFTGAGAGLLYLLGPTGGYLFGFVLAAFFIGKLLPHTSGRVLSTFLVFLAGDLILFTSGIIWLKVLLGYSLTKLLIIGFFPFIFGDLLKVAFATFLYRRLQHRLKEIF